MPVLAQMEQNGVFLRVEHLSSLSEELSLVEARLRSEIHQLAGEEFNISSPKQVQKILFDKLKVQEALGIKRLKKTKDGFSTDESVLSKLAAHPIVKLILEFRTITKLKGTYIDPLPQLLSPKTFRLHASFHQTGTATGRLSSSGPNLQNIPIRSAFGKKIRQAFAAQEPGSVIISADYSQIELRILAHLSGDEALINAFLSKEDIHRATAAKVFGVPLAEVTPEMRSSAKAVNYGIVYGMGAKSLAQSTGTSVAEAALFIEKYFRAYPSIRDYIEAQINLTKQRGYTETIRGRRRYIQDIDSRNEGLAANARNAAVNSPIQGSAADLAKLAMIRTAALLREGGFKTRLLAQVHDELLFEAPAEEAVAVRELIRRGMEEAMSLSVAVVADVGFGENWLEAH